MDLNQRKSRKQTYSGIDGATLITRAALFSIIWWALTDGAPGSWWVGAPAVACAVMVSVMLLPPQDLVWHEVMRFVPYFLWHSLRGGTDVAWRAFHPRMPIRPELIEYSLRLPQGLPQVMLVNTVSLLPGTLSVDIDGRVLKAHVLDDRGDFPAVLEALEQRVGRMWASATDECLRR